MRNTKDVDGRKRLRLGLWFESSNKAQALNSAMPFLSSALAPVVIVLLSSFLRLETSPCALSPLKCPTRDPRDRLSLKPSASRTRPDC
jgi:hypothetical protein